jgi:hypothetical protein
VTLSRRLKRQKGGKRQRGDKRQKPESAEPLEPETLDRVSTPWKRLFPFNFPGQLGDWLKNRMQPNRMSGAELKRTGE